MFCDALAAAPPELPDLPVTHTNNVPAVWLASLLCNWDCAAVSGTAFAPPSRGINSLWLSETSRQYTQKSYLHTIAQTSGGMRTDQARGPT